MIQYRIDELLARHKIMRKKRITVNQAVERLLKEGFSDALVNYCGLWVRQPEGVKKKYGGLFVGYIDREYDEHIAYIQIEEQPQRFI